METLQNEIAALRNVLSQQNDHSTSTAEPLKRRGYWYYVPSPQVRNENPFMDCFPCGKPFDGRKCTINSVGLGEIKEQILAGM